MAVSDIQRQYRMTVSPWGTVRRQEYGKGHALSIVTRAECGPANSAVLLAECTLPIVTRVHTPRQVRQTSPNVDAMREQRRQQQDAVWLGLGRAVASQRPRTPFVPDLR
jgi:hypothetical protein